MGIPISLYVKIGSLVSKNKLISFMSNLKFIVEKSNKIFLFVSEILLEIRLLNLFVSMPFVDKTADIEIMTNKDSIKKIEKIFFIIYFSNLPQ